MALTQSNLNLNLAWFLSATNAYNTSTTEGPDGINFALAPDPATVDQLFAHVYSIAASGTQAIDLTSMTNLVNESFTFMHVYAVVIKSTGGSITISKGPSNGFNFNFTGTTPAWTVNNGSCFAYCDATPLVVDSTHKNILLTNNSGSTSTVSIVILGSTT